MKTYEVRLTRGLIEGLLQTGAEHRAVRVAKGVPVGAELLNAEWDATNREVVLRFGDRDQVVPLLVGVEYR